MKKCTNPKCASTPQSIGEADNFCWMCGKEVAFIQRVCPKCGKTFGDNTHFCTQCGTPVEEVRLVPSTAGVHQYDTARTA